MSRVRRQVRVQLPSNPERRAICGKCVRSRLLSRPGIRSIEMREEGEHATLELDYDSDLYTMAELERELAREQACLDQNMACLVVPVGGMISPRAAQVIDSALGKLPGVTAKTSYAAQSLRLEFDRRQCPLPEIVARLEKLGYRADFAKARPGHIVIEAAGGPEATLQGKMMRAIRWLIGEPQVLLGIVAGVLLLAGFLVGLLGGPQWVRAVLLVLSYAAASRYTGLEALHTLRQFQFNIDVLMFAAAFGAAALGHYEEGGLLLFLFAVGNAGEHLSLERARGAIRQLASLAPDTARVRDEDGTERELNADEVKPGQAIIIRPYERIALDGVVIEGASAVDQAAITGESIPVEKTAGEGVFAGAINGEGRLVVRISRGAGESTLARIIKLVEEAQTTKSPTQLFTDKVERVYVPFVLIATSALVVLPPLLEIVPWRAHASIWGGWFYQAMAFLTAASPCALAIGTPSAVLCGIARAARIGVLIKGGAYLETLGGVESIAFDKTGTLTSGRPALTDIIPLDSTDPLEALALAAAVERESTHPLAVAITAEAQARGCAEYRAVDVEQVAGMGMVGRVDGRKVSVGRLQINLGSPTPSEEEASACAGIIERLSEDGKTTAAVVVDGRCIAVIGLADRPRDNARSVLLELKRQGISRTIMLTGDHRRAAEAIAREVGIDETFSELLPEDKLRIIQSLRERHGRVAMVGDGVNDAPALANATVGIAMGGASADIAMETADVVLMSNDLDKLPEAISLSRRARRIIAQNLLIALGTIAIVSPLAALGLTSLWLAVLLHEGSTVVVVLNSLRLLARTSSGQRPADAWEPPAPMLIVPSVSQVS